MIEIERHGGRCRAVVNVGADLGVAQGASVEGGPWVAGYGNTPDEALRTMYEEVGRHYVLAHCVGADAGRG